MKLTKLVYISKIFAYRFSRLEFMFLCTFFSTLAMPTTLPFCLAADSKRKDSSATEPSSSLSRRRSTKPSTKHEPPSTSPLPSCPPSPAKTITSGTTVVLAGEPVAAGGSGVRSRKSTAKPSGKLPGKTEELSADPVASESEHESTDGKRIKRKNVVAAPGNSKGRKTVETEVGLAVTSGAVVVLATDVVPLPSAAKTGGVGGRQRGRSSKISPKLEVYMFAVSFYDYIDWIM